ncbi:MAG: hypothetical protein Q9165_007877 [Trypethelium subeluteriae]
MVNEEPQVDIALAVQCPPNNKWTVAAEAFSGWGDGFINTTLHNGATGKNFGHNGATTVSFRAGGDWSWVLGNASASLPSYDPYVTIQFGHNDQKPTANISIPEFTANLVQFVTDVRNVPATPILVTSLSRRNYENTTDGPRIVENLADVTAAAIDAAQQAGCEYINLNQASEKYLNEIGPDDAYTYNLNPTDYTHLNDEGSIVFGNLVAMLMDQNVTGVGEYVSPEEEIAQALSEGLSGRDMCTKRSYEEMLSSRSLEFDLLIGD